MPTNSKKSVSSIFNTKHSQKHQRPDRKTVSFNPIEDVTAHEPDQPPNTIKKASSKALQPPAGSNARIAVPLIPSSKSLQPPAGSNARIAEPLIQTSKALQPPAGSNARIAIPLTQTSKALQPPAGSNARIAVPLNLPSEEIAPAIKSTAPSTSLTDQFSFNNSKRTLPVDSLQPAPSQAQSNSAPATSFQFNYQQPQDSAQNFVQTPFNQITQSQPPVTQFSTSGFSTAAAPIPNINHHTDTTNFVQQQSIQDQSYSANYSSQPSSNDFAQLPLPNIHEDDIEGWYEYLVAKAIYTQHPSDKDLANYLHELIQNCEINVPGFLPYIEQVKALYQQDPAALLNVEQTAENLKITSLQFLSGNIKILLSIGLSGGYGYLCKRKQQEIDLQNANIRQDQILWNQNQQYVYESSRRQVEQQLYQKPAAELPMTICSPIQPRLYDFHATCRYRPADFRPRRDLQPRQYLQPRQDLQLRKDSTKRPNQQSYSNTAFLQPQIAPNYKRGSGKFLREEINVETRRPITLTDDRIDTKTEQAYQKQHRTPTPAKQRTLGKTIQDLNRETVDSARRVATATFNVSCTLLIGFYCCLCTYGTPVAKALVELLFWISCIIASYIAEYGPVAINKTHTWVTTEGVKLAVDTMDSVKRRCVEVGSAVVTRARAAQQLLFGADQITNNQNGRMGKARMRGGNDPSHDENNQDDSSSAEDDDDDSIKDFEWNDKLDLNKPFSIADQQDHKIQAEDSLNHEEPLETERPTITNHFPRRLVSKYLDSCSDEEVTKLDISTLDLSDDRQLPPRLQTSTRRLKIREDEKQERARKAKEEQMRKEEEERIKAERLGRVEPPSNHKLFDHLSGELEERANAAINVRNPNKIVTNAFDGTEISGSSFNRLRPRQWLNDEIVNVAIGMYVKHALERLGHGKSRNTTPPVHVLNSMFYSKMADANARGNDPYATVARWAKKAKIGGADFLKCNLVLAPVNLGNAHWALLAFWPKHKNVEFYDSMYGSPGPVLRIAESYLEGELGKLYDQTEWTFRAGKSPAQTNGSDCGVFVCTTAKMLILGYEPEVSYTESHMDSQRVRIAAEILSGELAGELEPTFAEGWHN